MASGDLVFLDTETTGLVWRDHRVIELAWMMGDMFEPNIIIPFSWEPGLDKGPWAYADPRAMEINKFFERYPNGVKASPDVDVMRFLDAVKDSTLVGANVRFDARMLENTLGLDVEPWHHRLFDLQAYAAGVFGWAKPRSWGDVTAEIKDSVIAGVVGPGFTTMPDHSAASDTLSVKQAYEWLRWYSGGSIG